MYHKNQSQHAYLAAHKNPPSSHHQHSSVNTNNNNYIDKDFVVNQTYRKSPIHSAMHSKTNINSASSGVGGSSNKQSNNNTNSKRPKDKSQSTLQQTDQLSLGCGGKCAKFFLFLTNLLFWVISTSLTLHKTM